MDDLDDFLSRIDELTSDSFCSASSYSQEYQKLQVENKKLKQLLITKRNENNEIVELYRQKAQSVSNLQIERDRAVDNCSEIRKKHDELNKENINQNFTFTQQVNEIQENQLQLTKDYTDLCREFLGVLSDVTCFYTYEVSRVETKKTITKSEIFLRKSLGSAFEKPKILLTKRGSDTETVTSRTSTVATVKRPSRTVDTRSKRRKTDIWDMKSISQVSSPAPSIHFIDEGASDLSSGTFSIGNETSFSLLQSPNKPSEKICSCSCEDNSATLVSVGTNTDLLEMLPSVPSLLFEDSNEAVTDITIEDHNSSNEPSDRGIDVSDSSPEAPSPTKLVPTFVSSSTSTEPELFYEAKKLVSQGTSTDVCAPAVDKATSTVHSHTTRGNQTVNVQQSDKGVQMPEVSFEVIWEETLYDLPEMLSPLQDCEDHTREMGTITELCNVTREIDLVRTSTMTVDTQEPLSKNTVEEETSFSHLGRTLFRLFMKRLQKSSKAASNDEYTKKKIWRLLRRELTDRYSELTFDDLLNSACIEPEKYPSMRTDKEGHEEFAVESKSSVKMLSPIKDFQNVDESLVAQDEMPEPMICSEIEVETTTEQTIENTEITGIEEDLFGDLASTEEMCTIDDDPSDNSAINHSQSTFEKLKTAEDEPGTSTEGWTDKAEEAMSFLMHVETSAAQIRLVSPLKKMKSTDPVSPVKKIDRVAPVSPLEEINKNTDLTSLAEDTSNEILSKIGEFDEVPASTNELQRKMSENALDVMFHSEFEEAMDVFQHSLPSRSLLSQIEDLQDVIWSKFFPVEEANAEASPADDQALDGFDVDHEPIDIPLDSEVAQILQHQHQQPEFTEFDTPKSPPPFVESDPMHSATIVPTTTRKATKSNLHSKLEFDPEIRKSLVQWQEKHKISNKTSEKILYKARKAINAYIQSEQWTQQSLERCLELISSSCEPVLLQAIFETVEDNTMQDEINEEFSPPAPPLPRYQQKLILLVQKLSEQKPNLPHRLFEDLECKIFNLESFAARTFEELRNLSYWATALIDLFLDGDSTVALYFIVKCIYFFGFKSIPMAFAVIKAFPSTIPKKSQLMKKYCKDVDWENMTGLQLSKVQMNVEWIESLELTVMFLLTSSHQFRSKKNETCPIKDHELFSFLPKYYGFQLSFITAPKLLDALVQRLEAGRLENLSLSFVLLAKRTNAEFTVKTMLREKLVPLLNRLTAQTAADDLSPETTAKVCLLIEAISSILKGFSDEKEKSFGEIFALIVSILARSNDSTVKEYCLMAVLRLQRFIDSKHEIFKIVKDNYQVTNTNMNDTLSHSIQTFVHRKNANFFKES